MILEISRRDSFILPLELRVLNGMKYCIFLYVERLQIIDAIMNRKVPMNYSWFILIG
jgi:hypothetical protein